MSLLEINATGTLLGVQQDSALIDGAARFHAINPQHSFIVQAPAGSGKTSLLTLRFLALLTQVEQPEQIVAMTFTKKAAAEMRDRVMQALKKGLQALSPSASLNEQNMHCLASKVLERDKQLGWDLLSNPNRLRIKTIDGLNSYLVSQMPLLSKMGAQLQITDQLQPLYLEAVQLTFKHDAVQDGVARLLTLVNGRFNRAQGLLVSMLQKRDQWMGTLLHYTGEEARQALEGALRSIVEEQLQQSVSMLKAVQKPLEEICALADYAVDNGKPELSVLCGAWPLTANVEHLAAWRALADWILVKNGDGLRKRITKNEGFPSGKGEAAEKKTQFVNALADLSNRADSELFVEHLTMLASLPAPYYSDEQWENLQWLIELLRVAAAYLKVVFQSAGKVDFIEVAQAASQALGTELEPTELAQRLDYQIRHLLVDEFQDTSSEQFALMAKLTAGWQPDDGRTLFIVGDPMQSIYRFREAEVGNFLKAWQGQFGTVELTPLQLQLNFRSSKGVVDWVNKNFAKVLPSESNIEKGAVSYSEAVAFSDDNREAVFGHWHFNRTAEQEADEVVELIQSRLAEFEENDGKSIAILGRTRRSLTTIAAKLKQQGIAFKAVELEALDERQEVQDVLALCRAISHLSDKAAWIALLRSPLVGLTLNDLYALLGEHPFSVVWQRLQTVVQAGEADGLSVEGLSRLAVAEPIIQQAISRLGSLPFSVLMRELWLQLDGPLSVDDAIALQNVDAFWQVLSQFDNEALELAQLESLVERLFARPDSSLASQRIELMTMHKSKGLEFDTVILPGLGRRPRPDDKSLVSWFQFMPKQSDVEQLVISPLSQKGQEDSALNSLLKQFEAEKSRYELGRILYVAATRAKQQLHLFGQVSVNESSDIESLKPTNNSMLASLWSCVKTDFANRLKDIDYMNALFEQDDSEASEAQFIPKVSRLVLERDGFASVNESRIAQMNPLSTTVSATEVVSEQSREAGSPPYVTSSHQLALLNTSVGNLVHAIFEQMVLEGLDNWHVETWSQRESVYRLWLQQQGVSGDLLTQALVRVQRSVANGVANETLRWALASDFEQSATEYPLSSVDVNGVVAHHIVDRTFIDADGVRWIIDYKTSCFDDYQTEKAKQQFRSDLIAQYRDQLARYGDLFNQLETRSQKWVLYFSDIDIWQEVSAKSLL